MNREYTMSPPALAFSARLDRFSDSTDASVRRFHLPGSPHRSSSEKIGYLQDDITATLTKEFTGLLSPHFVRQLVNEATSLATTTQYPELFLPVLAEEKVRNASAWAVRQRRIRQQTISLAA